MFCSPSFVGKMEVCRVPEELRVMHTFAFFTVEPFNNGRYALEEFPQSMTQVGGLSWTWFSEVGCERNNANGSALPCSLASGSVGNSILLSTF